MYKKLFEELGISGLEYVDNIINDIDESLNNIGQMIPDIKKKNPGLIEDLLKILEK